MNIKLNWWPARIICPAMKNDNNTIYNRRYGSNFLAYYPNCDETIERKYSNTIAVSLNTVKEENRYFCSEWYHTEQYTCSVCISIFIDFAIMHFALLDPLAYQLKDEHWLHLQDIYINIWVITRPLKRLRNKVGKTKRQVNKKTSYQFCV